MLEEFNEILLIKISSKFIEKCKNKISNLDNDDKTFIINNVQNQFLDLKNRLQAYINN